MIAHATPTQIALYRAHKDRQARLNASAVSDRPANHNKPVRVIMRLPDPEHAPAMTIDPDAITRRKYARLRAVELGYTLDQIKAAGKRSKVIAAKHLIIWEIKTRWPGTSWPEIARIMGLADHSTVHYAFHKIQGMKDRGEIA